MLTALHRIFIFLAILIDCPNKWKVKTVNCAKKAWKTYIQPFLEQVCASSIESAPVRATRREFKVGEKVIVARSVEIVKAIQKCHGSWKSGMKKCVGKTGIVQENKKGGNVLVSFVHGDYSVEYNFNWRVLSGEQEIKESLQNTSDRLVEEAGKGTLDAVQELLKNQGLACLVNQRSSYGITALQAATYYGHMDLVEYLLAVGAGPDVTDDVGNTALHFSAMEGHHEITERLLQMHSNCKCARLLPQSMTCDVDHGAMGPSLSPSHGDICHEVKGWLLKMYLDCKCLKHKPPSMTFSPFLCQDNVCVVQILERIQEDCCVASFLMSRYSVYLQNSAGRTALHCAVTYEKLECMSILLKHMCDVNIQDRAGCTPLHKAVAMQNADIIKNLFEHGCDVNIPDMNGNRALHVAILGSCYQAAFALITHPLVNINATNHMGQSALHLALSRGCTALIGVLIEKGANVNSQDENSDTLLHICLKRYIEYKSDKTTPAFPLPSNTSCPQLEDLKKFLCDVDVEPGEVSNDALVICLLVKSGANLEQKNAEGTTPTDHILQLQNPRLAYRIYLSMPPESECPAKLTKVVISYLQQKGECTKCKVCTFQMVDTVLSCGHLICESCADSIVKSSNKHCPICRKPIKKRCKVFFS